MNVIVVIGMMGLMLLLNHRRGHHRPAPGPAHPATQPVASPTAPSGSPESVRPSMETPAGAVDEAGNGTETKPISHPDMQVDPQAE